MVMCNHLWDQETPAVPKNPYWEDLAISKPQMKES